MHLTAAQTVPRLRRIDAWTARLVGAACSSALAEQYQEIRHPELGDLDLDWNIFTYTGEPDQQLLLWSAEPGGSSHDKLRILASRLTATPVEMQ